MRVLILLLALLTTLPYSRAESDSAAYRSGDHSGGEYATVKAAQGGGAGHSGRGGGGGVTFGSGGAVGRGLGRGLQVSGVSSLDDFGNAVGAGTALGDSFQRGIAQVNARDRAITRAQELANQRSQKSSGGESRVARKDDQDRRSQLKENAYNSQDQQSRGSNSHQSGSQEESYDQGSEKGQKQIDVKDKHGTSLQSDGSYNRKDQAANAGNKALSANKNAYASLTDNFADINYGFKRNFNNNINERGGLKDSVGKDNTHSDVYEENQKDNRISRGFLDAFRRSNGNSAFRKESDWLSNAAQAQKLNNRFGAKDRLQNSANQNNADFNSHSDRRDDVFWHRDAAKDTSSRQANDQARKLADQQKRAEAQASGNKGVRDSKYYGGGNYAPGSGTGSGSGSGSGSGYDSFPITGHSGSGSQVGTAGNPYGNTGSGPVSSGGLAKGGNIVGRDLGGPGAVKGRQEGSGGAYLNQYGENARQSDDGGQKEASQAQSDAQALNNYSKGRGVDDSVQQRGQRRGQSSKDSSGRGDKLSQAYNNANADASAQAGLADKNLDLRQSSSNLDAANKNLQAQQVDRVNYKRNQVDTNQKVRKQKKFYHDKKEGGNNDEALNFNRNEGNQQAGEEQQAQKEARTSYNNAADDAKVNQQNRAYSNLDGRQISLADAFSRQKDQAGGWRQTNGQAQAQAQKTKAAADSGRQNTELDTFANNLSNRNQLLWASGQLNQARRERGSERDRALDGFFQFGPVRSADSLGLGGRQGSGGGQTVGSSFGQGSATFGSKRLPSSSFGGSQFGSGRLEGSKFGSGSGSSIGGSKLGGSSVGGSQVGGSKFGGSSVGGSQVGGSKFGGSSSSSGSGFSGSSFSSGFDSALGDFMDNMGSGKFGQFSFSQSPTGTHSWIGKK